MAAACQTGWGDKETKRNVVFLVPSDGIKPRIVLESLLSTESFIQHYRVRVLVDDDTGAVVSLLRDGGVPYEIVEDPGDPLDEILTLIDGLDELQFLVSCGWVELIPRAVFELATIGSVNCHSSYLPDYRGPTAVRAIWANGEKFGGATIHKLTERFDDGEIICQERIRVLVLDTPRSLLYRTSELTAVLLRESFRLLVDGYDGEKNSGGRYYPTVPWYRVILHGSINRFLWLLGTTRRWLIASRSRAG